MFSTQQNFNHWTEYKEIQYIYIYIYIYILSLELLSGKAIIIRSGLQGRRYATTAAIKNCAKWRTAVPFDWIMVSSDW